MSHGKRAGARKDTAAVWGVLGGAGPLASAEFLQTIYACGGEGPEQGWPRIVLFSDPSIPDRTETLLRGDRRALAEEVTWRARRLIAAGATKLVLCCITLHHVVPLLPQDVSETLVSLVDLIFEAVEGSEDRHLMMCSAGTRMLGLFEDDLRWEQVANRIIMPDLNDQRAIHSMIYEIKQHMDSPQHQELLDQLLDRYGVRSWIAGCTEMHILAKRSASRLDVGRRAACIDPLAILAADMCAVLT
jgi:aspartate racemase